MILEVDRCQTTLLKYHKSTHALEKPYGESFFSRQLKSYNGENTSGNHMIAHDACVYIYNSSNGL